MRRKINCRRDCDSAYDGLRNALLLRYSLSRTNKNIMGGKYPRILNTTFCLLLLIYFPVSCQGFCPKKCVCEYESLKVRCINASLEIVPFLLDPQIQSLSLPCNKIEAVGQSLNFYPNLKNVDMSYNHIDALEPSDFEAQEKLEVLNLSKNKINVIKNKSLVPLKGLKEIYLSNNNLASIEPNSFNSSQELKVLDLSNNKLQFLNVNTFSVNNNLETIKLDFNYFQNVPSNALRKIPSLQTLDLAGNLISEISKGAFRSLKNLVSLSLDKNNISVIHKESFEGLNQLGSLSLKDNRLSYISGDFFHPLENLLTLDLSGNLFQEIDMGAFPSLTSLHHLRMTRCPRLYRIDSQAFSNLQSLETLKLSHNTRLVYLGDSIFSSLRSLKDLDLTACGIIHILPSQMPRNSDTKLHLAGNPLHCNCSLMWLAEMPFNQSYYWDAPTCATPPDLYGTPVSQVDLRAAGCSHNLGFAAIGTCIAVVLLGLLVIAVFLAWRWSKRATLTSNKSLPGVTDRGIREPYWTAPPPPPPGPITTFPPTAPPTYASRYCLPPPPPPPPQQHLQQQQQQLQQQQTSVSPTSCCSHPQCQGECRGTPQPPYALHPATRPLLTPPSPSLNSHSPLGVGWLYPSPYDEDTHWYTTIGRDGREYLTGELNKPPLPQDSPPPHPPVSPHLKRGIDSPCPSPFGQRTQSFKKNEMKNKNNIDKNDRHQIPVTYI